MKVSVRGYDGKMCFMDVPDAIQTIVSSCYSEHGQLEDLQAQVIKLGDMIAELVIKLPQDEQMRFLNSMSYKNWRREES